MATRKLTITIDEKLYQELATETSNISAALSDASRWWLALKRQQRAVDEIIDETGIGPDPAELARAESLLDNY